MTDKERSLKKLKTGLRGPKKEINKMIEDISSDIDKNIGNSANYESIESSIGNADCLIEDFNTNYITYIDKHRQKIFRICTIILGCAGALFAIIGQAGKMIYINSDSVAKTGGADGPVEVIQEFEPYTALDVFELFTKVSVPILLVFILMVIIILVKRRRKYPPDVSKSVF